MYQLKLHKNLTTEKWSVNPFYKKILMIGNEVNRLKNAIQNKQAEDEILSCVERALELTDLTISCETRKSFLRELLRWRELFGAYYLTKNIEREKLENLYSSLLLMSPEAFNMLAE